MVNLTNDGFFPERLEGKESNKRYLYHNVTKKNCNFSEYQTSGGELISIYLSISLLFRGGSVDQ